MGAVEKDDLSVELKDKLRKTLKDKKTRHTDLVDILVPAWEARARRIHGITIEPWTPLYHRICTERGVYPHDSMA